MYLTICPTCQQHSHACKCDKTKTENVTYTGPNLPCSEIDTNDNLTLVIQKLNDVVCNPPITTSTTTTVVPLFKEYYALVSQTGTANITVQVVYNTIGNIVWTKANTGFFLGTLAGAFTTNKTFCFVTHATSNNVVTSMNQTSVNTVVLAAKNPTSGLNEDGLITTICSVHIKVFS